MNDDYGIISKTIKMAAKADARKSFDGNKFLLYWIGGLSAVIIVTVLIASLNVGKKTLKSEMTEHWHPSQQAGVSQGAPGAGAGSQAARLEGTYNQIAQSMNKVTASITGSRSRQGASGRIIGSGVFVGPQYLLSNLHVVQDAQTLDVTVYDPQKTSYPAVVVWTDPANDLAILKLQTVRTFPVARLGNSDPVDAGDIVFSVGNPLGFGNTITSGIISDKNRSFNAGGMTYHNMFQTSTDINEGSSGGPLVNIAGEVIGINTAIYAPNGCFTGIGFAVPIKRASPFLQQAGISMGQNPATADNLPNSTLAAGGCPGFAGCQPVATLAAGCTWAVGNPATAAGTAANITDSSGLNITSATPRRCPTCNALLYVRCQNCQRRMLRDSAGNWICPLGGGRPGWPSYACTLCPPRNRDTNNPFVQAA